MRALMIVGVVLGVLGAFISVFSLTCLTMNSMEDTTKAKMSLTAGIMFVIAGRGRCLDKRKYSTERLVCLSIKGYQSLSSCLCLCVSLP